MAKVDYSVLEVGRAIQVEADGTYYAAEVVEVSTAKKRAKAPVKVRYLGYGAENDEFVGADRIRSKALKAATKKEEAKPKSKKKGEKKETKPRPPLEFEMGYWGIRGLGSVLRMIFEYKEVKYSDNQYTDGAKWFKEDKPKLLEKNPLANLPYIVCGETVVCQTNAIMSYLTQRLRLGAYGKAGLMNEQLLCEIYDVRNGMIDLVYPFKKVNRTEAEYKESAEKLCDSPPFGKFEAWFEKFDTEYLTGAKPNTSDFHLWEMLDQHKMLAESLSKPSIFDKFPKCKAFYDRFRALPTLQKYFESEAYKLPINNKAMAGAYFA